MRMKYAIIQNIRARWGKKFRSRYVETRVDGTLYCHACQMVVRDKDSPTYSPHEFMSNHGVAVVLGHRKLTHQGI